jgi:hypothetical protein
VVQAFQKPLSVDGRDINISVSVGASFYPDHGEDAESLLQAADAALFRAKKMGRSQLSVFTPDLLETAAVNFTTEQGLRRAIDRGEFELLFQPELSVESFEVSLVEALIRWRMPDGTLVAPGQFLAIAEESGLIIEISDWVLQSAIEAASHWHHGAWPEACVAINVSPRQLLDDRFIDRLKALLELHDLPSHCIELELTESVLQTGSLDGRHLETPARARSRHCSGRFRHGILLVRLPRNPALEPHQIGPQPGGRHRHQSAQHGHHPRHYQYVPGPGTRHYRRRRGTPRAVQLPGGASSMFLQGFLLARPSPRDEIIPLLAVMGERARELVILSRTKAASNVLEFTPPASASAQSA